MSIGGSNNVEWDYLGLSRYLPQQRHVVEFFLSCPWCWDRRYSREEVSQCFLLHRRMLPNAMLNNILFSVQITFKWNLGIFRGPYQKCQQSKRIWYWHRNIKALLLYRMIVNRLLLVVNSNRVCLNRILKVCPNCSSRVGVGCYLGLSPTFDVAVSFVSQ